MPDSLNACGVIAYQKYFSFIIKLGFCIVFLIVNSLCPGKSQGALADRYLKTLSFDNFTQEQGLPNNIVQCICQDSRGWIWLGTSRGLSRFDGYRFDNFLPDPGDTTSLSGNLVRVIFEDRKGNLMIGTENGGLNIFDREKERFLHPFRYQKELRFREVSVNAIIQDDSGNLWIGTDQNLLMIDSLGNIEPVRFRINEDTDYMPQLFIRVINIDNQGKLWLGTNDGLFLYDRVSHLIEPVRLPITREQSQEIYEIYKDDDGSMWIGTYSKGIFIIDPVTRSVNPLNIIPYYERTETVRTISKSISGEYWIGTRGGLYVYSKTRGVTGFFKHDGRDSKSLANNSILDIFHDSKGEIWIGSRGGLNLLAKNKQVFRNFGAFQGDSHYLNSNIIYAFWIDKKGKIWIGTEDGGINILNPETGTYQYMMADSGVVNSISQDCIKAFLDDKRGNLWIGTFLGGLDVLNLKTGIISHYRHSVNDPHSLSDNRVWSLCLDHDGGIWIGTTAGLDRFNPDSKTFTHYNHVTGNEQVRWVNIDSEDNLWIGTINEVIVYDPHMEKIIRFNERSWSFYEDTKHRYWIATMDKGIALYSKTEGPKRYFDERDGLANNQALCILEDNDSDLWISTSNGLSEFNTEKYLFRSFTNEDGLRDNQFSYGAAYKTNNGELLFGGNSGFIMFNPDDIISDDMQVPLVFTDLRIFNKSVPIGDGKNSILTKSISETDHLFLRFDQNVFTLEFAALNFVNSNNNLYTYYLEGFDKDWNAPSNNRSATYTNLNPGDYNLRVRKVLPYNLSPGKELTLMITILPPFWMTWWFRIIIVLIIACLLFLLFRILMNREKIKNQLVMEKIKARNLHEFDTLKLRLFTNISHEIRTPLTLILGPLEKLMANKIPSDEIPDHLGLMHRNAKQLNILINQLLDFRKIETGNLKLQLSQGDMVIFISNIVRSFEDYAKEKEITLKFQSLKKGLIALFDPDKIEMIMNNLLSNALKFTGKGGIVSVHLSLVFDPVGEESLKNTSEKQFIEISIKDTGKGIAQENIEKIFTRFFQVSSEDGGHGTGIGLALVKELVKLHNGNISVISRPGKGSKFTVHLPYETEASSEAVEFKDESELPGKTHAITVQEKGEIPDNITSQIMLIVEDNQDVRYFIRNHFESVFTIFEARNGQEGWDLALNTIPDVIISDILMPDVDGYEFCTRIKNDERTSHIPLLLLTALRSREHEIKGLASGADDFISKPFDIEVLQTKIENMLSVRKSLRDKYTREVILQPSKITISSPDEHFLQKAINVIEKHISDPDLDIEGFASRVGVSRMQLYRKFNALTNMTVKEFIRSIRLKRAAQLLMEKKLTVTEIAYAVGFRDLSHFRKCFRQEYGMSASEYINQNSSSAKK